jgi:hypothetical protein
MALVTIQGGAKLDVPNQAEISAIVSAQLREYLRGIKPMRIPQVSGKAVAGALSVGQPQQSGPQSGYVWAVTRLVVTGLTSGGSPDQVNVYVNDASGNQQPLWNLNGNNFGYTFGFLQVTVRPGEILMMANVGTFAATGLIVLSGEAVECPAEMVAKLAVP